MKRIILTAYIGLAFSLLTGCGKSSTTNPPPSNNTISISGMTFSLSSTTVTKGRVVKWVNNCGTAHSATSNDGVTFDSGNLSAGASYSYPASTAGTFEYHCTIHGLGMSGTLIVAP